jgi:hypothetical protein
MDYVEEDAGVNEHGRDHTLSPLPPQPANQLRVCRPAWMATDGCLAARSGALLRSIVQEMDSEIKSPAYKPRSDAFN